MLTVPRLQRPVEVTAPSDPLGAQTDGSVIAAERRRVAALPIFQYRFGKRGAEGQADHRPRSRRATLPPHGRDGLETHARIL